METKHVPVMLEEVLSYLNPQPGDYVIDCTLGGGGYTAAIAERVGSKGKVLAFDLDTAAIERAKASLEKKYDNIIYINDNFKNLAEAVSDRLPQPQAFAGVMLDLGLSSDQLEDQGRGFSFKLDSPLDMTFAGDGKVAASILYSNGEDVLTEILRDYGEERYARRIARALVAARRKAPIERTSQLVEVIMGAVPSEYKRGKIHPATKTFQALRIAANRELENLESVLPQALGLLGEGGRIAVVSYHSLEDRIVKRYFKQESRDCLCPPVLPVCSCGHKASLRIVTKKAVAPEDGEVRQNPRARSAKLRVAEKL